MRKALIWIIVAAVVCIAGYFAVRQAIPPLARRAAPDEFSRPPELLTGEALGERRLLFDAKTTSGLGIEGPYRIERGTLELGGAEASRAVLEQTIEAGERFQFQFFQEGTAGAKLWIKPILIDPQDPYAGFRKDFAFDLKGYLDRLWHAGSIWFSEENSHADMRLEIRAVRDDHRQYERYGLNASRHFPTKAGCRYQIEFEVAPQAKLYLRNIVASKRVKAE